MQAHLPVHELQVRIGLPLRQVNDGGGMVDVQILTNANAVAALCAAEIVHLTEQATRSAFYTEGMSAEQAEANGRIPRISA